jgi:hypothetical protein
MSESTLLFQWSTWTLLLSVLAVAATAVFSYIAYRRSGFRTSFLILETLRVLLVAGAVILLNQPEWIERFRPNSKPVVMILGDRSGSMATRDVLPAGNGAGNSGSSPLTRSDAVTPWLDPKAWESLKDRFEVVLKTIDADPATGGSDLHAPLDKAIQDYPELRAVVMLSDGDWNSGPPPVQAAMKMRLEQIPILSAAVGSPTRLPDLELLSLDVPTFGIAGKTVRIPFTVESSLPREQTMTANIKISDGTVIEQPVRIQPMGRTSDAFIWKPTSTGDFTVTLTIPKHGEETIADNNELTAPIAIREEKLKVLVVESLPRWEYRYLRNALSRDPGVEVDCLLFHPGLSKVGGGNKDYIKGFPESLDQLAQYDVVFLGDVGVGDNQLTPEQCRLLKGLVEQQASGLVFMPGMQGRQLTLADTELEALYPVIMDPTQPGGWGSRTPSHFELTELGRRSLLTKLADTEEDNSQVWENLPGFQWYAPSIRAKAGSEVLAVHQDVSNQYGRVPLLATRTFGNGKVLYMGTDGAWRWRKGVEDLYHYRFWGQVVRWMAYQRNMAKGAAMRLYYSPEQPQVNQTLTFNANVMESSGEPLSKGNVSVRVISPSGKTQNVQLSALGGDWGAFSGPFTPTESGQHRLVLRCAETKDSLEATLFVQGGALEKIGKPSRPEVMEELARVTSGQSLRLDQLEDAVKRLAALPEQPEKIRRVQLWSHPAIAGTLILGMAVFWIGRKWAGLV